MTYRPPQTKCSPGFIDAIDTATALLTDLHDGADALYKAAYALGVRGSDENFDRFNAAYLTLQEAEVRLRGHLVHMTPDGAVSR